jgi:phosphoribosyl-ATP pyrophosphohydrolase/phosphoribosyl-AMP cyclohydrolase/histidinol dehydrogenase
MNLLPRISPEQAIERTRSSVPPEILEGAARIVEDVRTGGEPSLREYATSLDGLEPSAPLVLGREELRQAREALDPDERALLERTANRIREFAGVQLGALREVHLTANGLELGQRITAVPSAACYAPGGRYPLPSSVLMTACTARVAGVDRVVVASPDPAPIMLAAADLAGADLFVAAGGAQAIAALAFGAGSVPACDVIVGPGNAWVTAAKQIVAGPVRIDALAGPSELLVVVDGDSDPVLVAADLLAQAEHDPRAVPLLVAFEEEIVPRVERELDRQLADLPSADVARLALQNGGYLVVGGPGEAVRLCNEIAPEHLQWMAKDEEPTGGLLHYGGLFVGSGAAEVLGDYGAGPNHVLPTGGQARARGGLSVLDFVKVSTWMRAIPGADTGPVAADAGALAGIEGLQGHARAAKLRLRP